MSGLFDKAAPLTLRAVSALTTSYVDSEDLDVSTHSMVTLVATYVPDDGEGAFLLPEVQHQGSSAWVPAVSTLSADTPAAGMVDAQLLGARYAIADGARLLHVPVYGASKFRVRALEGGTPSTPGTLEIVAIRSRVGA